MSMNDKQRQAYDRAKSGQGFTPDPARTQSAPAPEQPAASGPSDGDRRALATSTAAAHGLRTRLNQDIGHAAGLQEAYTAAATATADEAAAFFAAAMSGELFWNEVSRRTQEKLAALPKPEEVPDFSQGLKRLPPLSWQHSGATQNRYLPSVTGSFGELPPAS